MNGLRRSEGWIVHFSGWDSSLGGKKREDFRKFPLDFTVGIER